MFIQTLQLLVIVNVGSIVNVLYRTIIRFATTYKFLHDAAFISEIIAFGNIFRFPDEHSKKIPFRHGSLYAELFAISHDIGVRARHTFYPSRRSIETNPSDDRRSTREKSIFDGGLMAVLERVTQRICRSSIR